MLYVIHCNNTITLLPLCTKITESEDSLSKITTVGNIRNYLQ